MLKTAIIVAGGSGTRMGSKLPKQFLQVNEEIILMRSIRIFHEYDSKIKIILALHQEYFQFWKKLCAEHHFTIEHQIAEGGKTRYHSVKNALELAPEKGLIAIHDAVRPFASKKTIKSCFDQAKKYGNAIPCVDIKESLRIDDEGLNRPVKREKFKMIQTPQVFKAGLIKDAYKQAFQEKFTDDATVLESCGININLIEGNRENIKITTPLDLKIAGVFD